MWFPRRRSKSVRYDPSITMCYASDQDIQTNNNNENLPKRIRLLCGQFHISKQQQQQQQQQQWRQQRQQRRQQQFREKNKQQKLTNKSIHESRTLTLSLRCELLSDRFSGSQS